MAVTRTGAFPIAFRRGWSDWQKDLPGVIAFARDNGFEGLDVGPLEANDLRTILAAGLKIGSIDLPQPWGDLASADAGKRRAVAQTLAAYIQRIAPLGPRVFFVVVFPEDHAAKRSDNLARAVDGYGQLCAAVAPTGARIVVEGWPGSEPHCSSLACTPEGYRTLFRELPGPVMGVNFDPSHLIRMGIDSFRFLEEFAPRVAHVHAKDTELFPDALYEFGDLQGASDATHKPHGFGAHHWRYTIPGHGVAPWGRLLAVLQRTGYRGLVSVELEDENFNGTEAGEKRGLLASRDFLVHV